MDDRHNYLIAMKWKRNGIETCKLTHTLVMGNEK